MDIKFETIKRLMKEKKYIATDEIVWDVIKGIKKMKNGKQMGQDLYSICLEGPPGAGKSFYAKTYKKVIADVFGEDVEFLEYQCDSSTGKTDLFEEIRVAAAITGNKDEVIISGMLVEAIDAVNSGKKVVLLLDEFEKSRKETDAFMYQFLQDGKIKTTQRGVVEIKPEYKKNLQVILCKNDERELADPLLRRNHIIRLDVMTPKNFAETVNMNLPQCDEDIRNIVSLLYEKMYQERENFASIPSCSEGMLAIQDACDLLEEDAPAEVIYADILSNLLKHPDDIESFKMMFKNDKKLSSFVKKLQQAKKQQDLSAKDEIYRSFFSKEIQKLSGMQDYYEKNKSIYEGKIKSLSQQVSELKKKQANSAQNSKEDTNVNNSKSNNTSVDNSSIGINLTPQYIANLSDPNSEVAQKLLEQIKFMSGEESALEGLPVDVPIDIVNNQTSIFAGSDNWYEIMEIEVEEEGWESLEKIVQGGIEEYIKQYCIQQGITIEGLKKYQHLQNKYDGIYKLLCDKNNVDKKWFKDMICYDGIVLENPTNVAYAKIVAQKQQTEDGKNCYKIFSNKMIQNRDLYNCSLYTLINGYVKYPYTR